MIQLKADHLMFMLQVHEERKKLAALSATKTKLFIQLDKLELLEVDVNDWIYLTDKGKQLLAMTIEMFNDQGHNL